MDHFISMYIDNELSLDEKILFLRQCCENREYSENAVSLIKQEKLLSGVLRHSAPEMGMPVSPARGKIIPFSLHSMGWAVAACLLLFFSFSLIHDRSSNLQGGKSTVAASRSSSWSCRLSYTNATSVASSRSWTRSAPTRNRGCRRPFGRSSSW